MRQWITRTRQACLSVVGYSVIGMAAVQLALPWFLPVTLNPAKVERLLSIYYQDLNIGSVHVTWEQGRLNLLIQDVRTPQGAKQKLNARRIVLQPNLFKSLWQQKLVLRKALIYQGHLDLKLTTETIEFGSLQLPLDLPKDPPVYFQNLQFQKVQVALRTPKQTLDLTVPHVQLTQHNALASLKARVVRNDDPSRWLNLFFDFERGHKGLKKGQLNIQGHNQELNHLFEMIQWPGAQFDGSADFQFWASFKDNDIERGLLDLQGDHITLRKSNGRYDLDHLAGRFAYQVKDGVPQWFGQGLTLIHDGQALPSSEFYMTQPNQHTFELTGTHFDLSLIHFILQDNPKIHQALSSFDLEPTGLIPYVRMTFENGSVTPSYMLLEAQNLSFKQKDLEVTGLAGKLYFQHQQLHTHWQGDHVTISNAQWFEKPLILKKYSVKGLYDIERQLIQGKAQGQLESGILNADLALALQQSPQLDLSIQSPKLAVHDVQRALPLEKLNPHFVEWLRKALVSGYVEDLGFQYQGELNGFFDPNNPKAYRLETQLNNVYLRYDEKWPDLEHLDGKLVIDRHAVDIHGSGTLKGSSARTIHAHIPDLRAIPQTLTVQTDIQGPAQDVWSALAHRGFLAPRFYDATQWQGNTQLGLSLNIPLAKDKKPPTFHGTVDFSQASLSHESPLIEAKQLSGALHFDESTIRAKGLKSLWHGYPLESDLSLDFTKKDPILSLSMTSEIEPNAMHEKITFLPGTAHLKGHLDWHLRDETESTFSLEGDFKEVAMNLPSPLNKDHGKPSKLSIGTQFLSKDEILVNARLDDKLAGRMKLHHKDGLYQPVQGHLHIGSGPMKKPSKLPWYLEGYVEQLNQEQWQSFFSSLNLEQNTMADSVGFYLMVDNMMWHSQAIRALVLEGEFDSEKQSWQVDMTSPKLQGMAELPLDIEEPWSFKLDHLYLSKSTEVGSSHFDLPARGMIVNIRHLEGSSFKLKDFNLQLMPQDGGHAIQDFSFKTDRSIFDATGQWIHGIEPGFVTLKGQIMTRDAGEFLSSFGRSGSIRKGKGLASFDVSFNGHLLKPNMPSLKGKGELTLEKGYIQGVNAGIGRLLSLINIDTIQRRLQLDFSDVTDEGFAFDTLEGRYEIGQGKLKTDDLAISAPSANIEFKGELGLVSEKVDANIVVMPNVTGSLPLAAAIATGNPAVGAAVWLMDKVLGKTIQEMTRYNYTVTGTLDSPNVKEDVSYPPKRLSRRKD